MNKLDQLKQMTDVVADTGDVEAIARYKPKDATTNPSLLLKAVQLPAYKDLFDEVRQWAAVQTDSSEVILAQSCDRLAVEIGTGILQMIPGRVSSEVDARLSFDTAATIARARHLIAMYDERGIARDRVLIKIASTWEGIEAARQLEQESIQCNLTLLFGFAQARACADAGVFLISPFVGRILDWHKAKSGQEYSAADDPGVQSVKRIYRYYKTNNYDTVVMGASFRNTGEIEQLAGCDRLTISPALLESLASDEGDLSKVLHTDGVQSEDDKQVLNESAFRLGHNDDAMATEKLADGIRQFAADQVKLEQLIMAS
ncbi:MAG: transaldolase [Candidatus Azotimanducaceae bacterium]|jgi:transaldolase